MVKTLPEVSWDAEEYIQYKHNLGWYIALFVIGGLLILLSVYLQWWTFIALIVVCIIAILVSAARPPRKIHYTLTKDGLMEGNHLHKYEDFRAFGILKEDSHFSAVLIVDALGAHLPMEEVKLDLLDKLVNFLRI